MFGTVSKNTHDDILKDDNHKQPEVLYVEDDPITQSVVKLFLKNICIVDVVSNTDDAIKLASSKEYAAVLMDINLSGGISGLELVKKIKKLDNYSDIPCIAVTGYAMSGDKEKILSRGCTHYISKPFDRDSLVNLMSSLLSPDK